MPGLKTRLAFNIAACTVTAAGAVGGLALFHHALSQPAIEPGLSATSLVLYAASCYGLQHSARQVGACLNKKPPAP